MLPCLIVFLAHRAALFLIRVDINSSVDTLLTFNFFAALRLGVVHVAQD